MKWIFLVGAVLVAIVLSVQLLRRPEEPKPQPTPTTQVSSPVQTPAPTQAASTTQIGAPAPLLPGASAPNPLDPMGALSPSTPAPAGPTPADYAVAKREIIATLKAQPKSFPLHMQAAEFFMRAADYSSAIAPLQVATRLEPKQTVAWIALGDAATLTRKFPLAEQAYARATVLAPEHPQLTRGKGQMLILQKKFEPARQLLEAGLKRHPNDVEIRTVLGNLYLVLNKPAQVIATLKPALEQQPDRPDLHYIIGEAYARDLHVENAIRELQEAVRLEPGMVQAWGLLGLYHINLSRFKEARPYLERAIALDPKEAHYEWALGESYLLDSSDPANFDRAVELYRKALQLDPKNQKALYSYGMAMARRGKPEDLKQAVTYFERLVALKPTDTQAHFKLYDSYRRLGMKEKAQEHRAKFRDLFEKGRQQTYEKYSAEAFVDTAEAHLKRAQRAMAQGDYKTAAQEFEFTLERDGNSEAAKRGLAEAKRRLGQDGGGRAH